MRYVTLGRKLGRGTRMAAERLRSQAAGARQKTPQYVAQGRIVARGGKRAGESFWKRLAHAGRMLWHEVTGVFFALFAMFFAQGMWRVHEAYRQGAEHRHFMLYLGMTVLFTYFSVSAFLTSRRRLR